MTVFVFGSNLAGRHGKGAALDAASKYGAEYGVGEGRTGNAYAIPTKDVYLKTLPLENIEKSYKRFWKYAKLRPDTVFLVTPFGTGLAGYSVEDIWPIIKKCGMLRNLWFTGDWFN